jgi:hypothetical protein
VNHGEWFRRLTTDCGYRVNAALGKESASHGIDIDALEEKRMEIAYTPRIFAVRV